jgi:hypothetical protein
MQSKIQSNEVLFSEESNALRILYDDDAKVACPDKSYFKILDDCFISLISKVDSQSLNSLQGKWTIFHTFNNLRYRATIIRQRITYNDKTGIEVKIKLSDGRFFHEDVKGLKILYENISRCNYVRWSMLDRSEFKRLPSVVDFIKKQLGIEDKVQLCFYYHSVLNIIDFKGYDKKTGNTVSVCFKKCNTESIPFEDMWQEEE